MGHRFKLIGADAGALVNPVVVGRGVFEPPGECGGFSVLLLLLLLHFLDS